MALDVKRFTARFVDDARDHLRRLEDGLTGLRDAPDDLELLNGIFRSAHSVKGASGMLKLAPIHQLAHELEELLDALRNGGVALSEDLLRLLHRTVDSIALRVDQLAGQVAMTPADPGLCDALRRAVGTLPAVPAAGQGDAGTGIDAAPPLATLQAAETVRVSMQKLDDLIKLMGDVVSSHARLRQRLSEIGGIVRSAGRDAALLGNFVRDFKDDVLAQDLLMQELHGKTLVMRMLPMAHIFDSAPRFVRDLAQSVGKDVDCTVTGTDIELDRHLLDRLSDPIVHLLRNAVDHGIESPDQRRKLGKPKAGHIVIDAQQDSGAVVITIDDDGAGISADALRDRAVRMGLMSVAQAAALSEAEAINLIFRAGFSTSVLITDMSGRGVGMDVVKSCIVDDLQGAVGVETRPGLGSRFILRLPLSLAVMRVLLVEAGGEYFGFTAQHVSHLLHLSESTQAMVADRPVIPVQDELVPIVDLAHLLSLPTTRTDADDMLLVVVKVQNERLALRIDRLLDERDMVLKALPDHLAGLGLASAMVVTGSNALAAVLHAPALLELSRRTQNPSTTAKEIRGAHLLVVDDSLNTREIERDVLEAHGYRVTLAEDGLDGLRKALDGAYDAVLTDVEMPNMDGFTLTANLRQTAQYRHVPIIIITSRQKEEDKRRGIEVGADAYIVKGDFDQNGLISTLKGLLG